MTTVLRPAHQMQPFRSLATCTTPAGEHRPSNSRAFETPPRIEHEPPLAIRAPRPHDADPSTSAQCWSLFAIPMTVHFVVERGPTTDGTSFPPLARRLGRLIVGLPLPQPVKSQPPTTRLDRFRPVQGPRPVQCPHTKSRQHLPEPRSVRD